MRQEKRTLPYGTWPSPIGPQSLAEGIRFTDVGWDSDGATLVWREERSDRGVLVCLPATGEAPRDLTTELSVRARVGYGGGDFTVAGGMAYFVEANGRLYRQPLAHGVAASLTPACGYAAAPTVSPDHRFVVFVHTYEEQDCLAIVDIEGCHWPQKFVSGADFYMQPCWHPQGERLAWVAWNHPQMPWEGSLLQLGTVCRDAHGLPYIADVRTLAGSESIGIFQPTFSPDGRFLAYISNESGWDSLYLYDLEAGSHRALLADHRTDIGQPAWAQGMRTYGFRYDGKVLYYLPNEHGVRRLWSYNLATGTAKEHHMGLEPYTFLDQPALAPTHPMLACIASAATSPSRIITLNLDDTLHKPH